MKNLKRFESLPMLFFFTAPFWNKNQFPAWANWIFIGLSVLMLIYALWCLQDNIKSEENNDPQHS
jgi:NADH:ubiquinone oxidoreductase subunit 5 (subunit L)/multisubunit Na+/H+ antiporter MnhA subunit